MWVGALGAADVGAHVRGEVAAGAGVHRHVERQRHRQRPHRVGLRLLLEGDRQHPLVHAGLHERRRRRSRSSRRPSRRCAPAAAACRRRRAPRPGTARASSRPRTGRAPCRRRSRRCRRSVMLASASARSIASRHRPAIETSSRLARWWVWPTPITAAGCLPISARPSIDAHEVLLQRRAAGRVAEHLGRPRRTRPAWRPRRSGSGRR